MPMSAVAKMSKSRKGNKNALGMKHTEEVKERIRQANIGNKHREGKKLSEEHVTAIIMANKGEKNGNWRGGITPANLLFRESREYSTWRKSVFDRDEYECQICEDRTGGNLHANHIKRFSDCPDLRLDPDNGITLCKRCHIGTVTGHEQEWESYFKFNLATRFLM